MPAFFFVANGTVCDDFDPTTSNDTCRGGICEGSPVTCGNQNVQCPLVNQRLNYQSRCVPGSNCTAAACCRFCNAVNLVTNGGFVGGFTGWSADNRWSWKRNGYVFATSSTSTSNVVLSQQVMAGPKLSAGTHGLFLTPILSPQVSNLAYACGNGGNTSTLRIVVDMQSQDYTFDSSGATLAMRLGGTSYMLASVPSGPGAKIGLIYAQNGATATPAQTLGNFVTTTVFIDIPCSSVVTAVPNTLAFTLNNGDDFALLGVAIPSCQLETCGTAYNGTCPGFKPQQACTPGNLRGTLLRRLVGSQSNRTHADHYKVYSAERELYAMMYSDA
jgi:hypothetical protein